VSCECKNDAMPVMQLGWVLERWGGLAVEMVRACAQSARALVAALARELPGFRDEAIYKGRRVFFYKRAQILVADLWAAYGRQRDGDSPFAFRDIEALTMFADYRVPQLLMPLGVLHYSPELAAAVEGRCELGPGSEEEVEIRAASVQAVEVLREKLGGTLLSVEIDWLLWQEGEKQRFELPPHHRTLSVCY
jgi:hypothetical protein